MWIFLLIACAVTVILETGWFWMFGYDSRDAMTVVACANVVTNLVLNLLLSTVLAPRTLWDVIIPELVVVLVEYAIYACAFGRSRKLFALTLAANAVSFGAGLLIF